MMNVGVEGTEQEYNWEAWKNEWAQKCNGAMASRFTRMYGIFLGMGM